MESWNRSFKHPFICLDESDNDAPSMVTLLFWMTFIMMMMDLPLKSRVELRFIKMQQSVLALVVSLQWLVQERAICDILSSEFPQIGCPLDTIHWIVKRQTATVGNGPGQDRARVRTDASETNGSWT